MTSTSIKSTADDDESSLPTLHFYINRQDILKLHIIIIIKSYSLERQLLFCRDIKTQPFTRAHDLRLKGLSFIVLQFFLPI